MTSHTVDIDDYDNELFSQLPLHERMLLRDLRKDKLWKYGQNSVNALLEKQGTIEEVRAQNELLREEIAVDDKLGRMSPVRNEFCRESIKTLMDQADLYMTNIEKEKKKIKSLDERLDKLRRQDIEQHCVMNGELAYMRNNALINRKIRVLERELERKLAKFNKTHGENVAQRKLIDELRNERVSADNVFARVGREVQENAKKMARLSRPGQDAGPSAEKRSRGHDSHGGHHHGGSHHHHGSEDDEIDYTLHQRDEIHAEMEGIKAQWEAEQREFEQQCRDLEADIASDIDKARALQAKRMNNPTALVEPEGGGEGDGTLSSAQEKRIKKQITKTRWGLAKTKLLMNVADVKISSFEEALTKIQESSGIDNIDTLVDTFIRQERQNYSLLQFVNAQSAEAEALEEQCKELRAERERYSGGTDERIFHRNHIMHELEGRLRSTQEKGAEYERKLKGAERALGETAKAVDKLYLRIGCDKMQAPLSMPQDLLHVDTMTKLGVIEQRAREIVSTWVAKMPDSKGGSDFSFQPPSSPPGRATGSKGYAVTVPDTSAFQIPEFDDDEPPLYFQDLTKEVQCRPGGAQWMMQQRNGAGGGGSGKGSDQPRKGRHKQS